MRTLSHFGIITNEKKEGAVFNDVLGVWLTDYSKSRNKIEWLCFEEGSIMHPLIRTESHIAYIVSDIKKELEGKKILFEPMKCDDHLTIAFIEEEGIPVEIMEIK